MENNNVQPELKKKKTITPVIIIIAIAIIAIVAVLSVLIAKGQNGKKYKDSLALAQRYLDDEDYERAIAAFEDAIAIDPKSEDAYIGIADVYIAMGDEELSESNFEEAIDNYEKALEWLEEGADNTSSDKIDKYIKDVKKKIEEAKEEMDDESKDEGLGDLIQEEKIEEDTDDDVENDTEINIPDFSELSEGDTVIFGSFEGQPIEWDVLETEEGCVLLISHYVLTYRAYDQEGTSDLVDTNWEQSEIRAWLNNEFYNSSFTKGEKAIIQTSLNSNLSSAEFFATYYPNCYFEENSSPCGNTEDKVFLLSWEEVEKYYGVELGAPDWDLDNKYAFSYKAIATDINGNDGCWWLRSAGYHGYIAMNVYDFGLVGDFNVNYNYNTGVRPALRVSY